MSLVSKNYFKTFVNVRRRFICKSVFVPSFVVSVLYHHLYRVVAARQLYVRRGAFACKSLSSFFFSPPNSYLSSGGRREIEVFFLLLLLTYSATVEVSSSKMVKRESTQVENESGKAYHLISKVYPMTFVCRLQRRRRRRRRHRHASPDYKSKGATNFYSYLYTLNFV